ncbi:hypothetical protein LOD99_3837 [Oopsacas minuta]|uniref:Uncharacterized protein n=1 Tax=Oopsacas minuta TaxID=111878 RepID=A0AAV7JWG4_9METZ|nr:hypothetical protein LOD99_3837 [Oopsacas minuta]
MAAVNSIQHLFSYSIYLTPDWSISGWSFYIAWIGLFIAFLGALYFSGVTIYRYKNRWLPGRGAQDTQPFIRPTQFLHLQGANDVLDSDDDDTD